MTDAAMGMAMESVIEGRAPAGSSRRAFLEWLDRLLDTQGPGEYTLTLRQDNSVTVRKRIDPIKFEWR